MTQLKDLFRAYKVAHKYREAWYNIKWRAVVIAVTVFIIALVYMYLNEKFPFVIDVNPLVAEPFFLGEKLFYWFMIGALFGIISVGLIFEGEFLIGLRHISKELAEAERHLTGKAAPKAKKAVKRGK